MDGGQIKNKCSFYSFRISFDLSPKVVWASTLWEEPSQVCGGCTFIIPALGRLGQENCKFKSSLGYAVKKKQTKEPLHIGLLLWSQITAPLSSVVLSTAVLHLTLMVTCGVAWESLLLHEASWLMLSWSLLWE
jgi:hypothetical protein